MENTAPSTVAGSHAQPVMQESCDSLSHLMFGFGVVALIFGPAITGHAQASMVGLALIVFSNFVD